MSPGTMVNMLFKFFAVFRNWKSSFSEDRMPVHALDVFIENATKMVRIIPLKYERGQRSGIDTIKHHT